MNKKTVKTLMLVLILIAIAVYFITGTYARYATKFTGNATAQVAKWAVKLSNDDEGTKTTIENLTFKVADNTNVVKDKIAPGTIAVAEVEIDLTGTEVAVDISAEILKNDLEDVFGESSKNVTLTADIDGTTESSGSTVTKKIDLPNNKAFDASNGKKKLKLILYWDNKHDTSNDSDTNAGKNAKELKIPVTLTVQQHIDEE